jgi:hypothetical protein
MLALAGCTPRQVRIAHVASAAIAAAAFACDWSETRDNAARGWRATYEANPMLGTHPSTGTVDFYFASLAATILLTELLPERWRSVVYLPVAGLELETVGANYRDGTRCM